jgi:hypothetical protein
MPEMLPFELIKQSACAFFLSRCLQIVADAGVADAIAEEGATLSALADITGLNSHALGRVLNRDVSVRIAAA